MESINPSNLTNENIQALLATITSPQPNNEQIKQATEVLKKYSENILSVEGLLYQMKNNQDFKARQLASIILYKCIDRHWLQIDSQKQTLIKQLIMELYAKEKVYLVLKGISNIIYKICKRSLINNEWDDLLNLVFASPNKYSNDQAELFELNLYVIAELASSCMEQIKPKLPIIGEILNTSLTNGNIKMKENATQCLASLISNLEKEEIKAYKGFIAPVLQEIEKFSEKNILKIFETFCDFHLKSLDFFEDRFDDIIPVSFKLLSNEELNSNTKLVVSEFLNMLSQFKKKLYTKNDNQYLKQFLLIAFSFLSNEDNEHETELTSETSLFTIGSNMINQITNVISSKRTFPILIELIKTNVTSQKKWQRRAAIAIVGEMAEGCATQMKDNIEDIINLLINTFETEPEQSIKGQCIVSMDQVSQNCNPEINEYYDKIIPMLYKGLFSESEDIVEKSLIEINYFCSMVDFEMEDYLNMNLEMNSQLLQKLINILETSKSMWILEKTLDALGSVVSNAQNLQPVSLMPIIETLKQITMTKTTVNDQRLIGRTLNCVANISSVIKYEKFQPFEEFFAKFAYECIKSTVYELQFGGLSFFTSLADIKGEAFAPALDEVMTETIKILKDKSGIVEKAKAKDEFTLDSDSEDEMEGNGEVYWNEDFMETKSNALRAVGSFAKAASVQFVKYFKDFLVLLDEFTDYICDTVVFESIGTYEALMFALEKANKALGSSETSVNNFWVTEVFSKFEELINNTDDQQLVSEIICSIYVIVDHFGKDLFVGNNTIDRCIQIAKSLLSNQMPCQIKNEDAEEDELDYEEDIIDSVKNLCLIFAEKLKNDFHPYFNELMPLLKKYLKTSHPEEDRSLAFGIIADVLKNSTISTKFFIEQLFTFIESNLSLKKINKKNESLLRHIAYLIGVLFESDPEAAKPYLNASLNHLQYIFEKTKREAKDNVIASLCRIITSLKLNKTNFPLFDKSVETIMTNLPFKYDPIENITALDFLVYLIDVFGIEEYTKYCDGIMKVLQILVVNDAKCKTKEEDLAKIRNYINTLNKNETIKGMIEKYVLEKFTQNEKDKFVTKITNAK